MKPRPEGYREPTDEEKQCLPEGTLIFLDGTETWVLCAGVGKEAHEGVQYAVPTTTDPKGEAGKLKCPLWLIPPYSMEEAAWVHGLGAEKYGPWNWRDTKVAASVYVSAILRHLNAWRSGEDLDPESGRSHLAHIIAGCNIVMDAEKHGNLIDDRRKS